MPRRLLLLVLCLTLLPVRAQAPRVPDKLVVLTFDDSKASHYSVVRPLLKQFGFGATFFITEGFSFRSNQADYLTWEQIAELHRDGVAYEPGLDHPLLLPSAGDARPTWTLEHFTRAVSQATNGRIAIVQ